MAQGDRIPDEHHITKLIGKTKIDIIDGQERVSAHVFLPRPVVDDYLSINWFEYDGNTDYQQCLEQLRKLAENNPKLTVKNSSRFPVINVGKMRQNVQDNTGNKRDLLTQHEPLIEDPSHSGLYGYDLKDQEIAEYIAQSVDKIEYVRPEAQDVPTTS